MIKLLNLIIKGLAVAGTAVLSLLPSTPFVLYNVDNKIVRYMNYAFPIPAAVTLLTAWVAAVGAYYGIRKIMRWLKEIN